MRSKKLLARLAVTSLIAAAFATAAIAADTATASNEGAPASAAVARSDATTGVTWVAAIVREAIAGPDASVTGSQGSGLEPRGLANKGGDVSSVISAARRVNAPGTVGTVGVRPGWGCGDTNHTHSGPPGRPNADPPPGCDR